LITKFHQRFDQAGTLERFSIASVELEDVDAVCLKPLKTRLKVLCDDVTSPDVINFKVVLVLLVNTAAFCREVVLASSPADVATDSLLADAVIRNVSAASSLTTRTPQVFGPRSPMLP
jgi:hypothetical protein